VVAHIIYSFLETVRGHEEIFREATIVPARVHKASKNRHPRAIYVVTDVLLSPATRSIAFDNIAFYDVITVPSWGQYAPLCMKGAALRP
jgi:hypothetical protein